MAYVDTPLANEDLDVSQPLIRGNFSQANASFGVDHYNFSNLTVNNGKHNLVTTPLIIGAVHPVTAINEPKIYAMQDTANLGVLNYSRGGSSAVPTPLTSIHSVAGGASIPAFTSINILDFTGILIAIGQFHSFNSLFPNVSSTSSTFFWNGTTFKIVSMSGTNSPSTLLTQGSSGSNLTLTNTSASGINNAYWTVELSRVEV